MGVSWSTPLGYATLAAVSLGYYLYVHNKDKQRREVRAPKARPEDRRLQPKKEKDTKAKHQRLNAYSSVSHDGAAAETAQERVAPVPAKTNVAATQDSSDEGADARKFARQFAKMKDAAKSTGPAKTSKSNKQKRQKSVKQSRAEEASTPSSTAEVEGDDDHSPISSPVVSATEAGDVADMLEKTAPGPSTMRITASEKPQLKAREKNVAKEPEVESKKQRQNRKKAEAAKAAREEAEEDRKVKLEAQRRLARVAEGRAAKDGSAFMASQAAGNAWAAGTSAGVGTNGPNTNGSAPIQPLDTFEPPVAKAAPVVARKVPSATDNGDGWKNTQLSEEEQMALLRSEEDWNTVQAKPRRSKKQSAAAAAEDESNDDVAAPKASEPVSTPAPKQPATKTNGKPAFKSNSSFAALSIEDQSAEQETEWDV